jgi:uncharacterized protein YegP (UPF0339 family)
MSTSNRLRFAVYKMDSGLWAWRATRSGHTLAVGDDGYERRARALDAIQRFVDAIEQKQYLVVQPDTLMEE